MMWGKSTPSSEMSGPKSEMTLGYLVSERRHMPGAPVKGDLTERYMVLAGLTLFTLGLITCYSALHLPCRSCLVTVFLLLRAHFSLRNILLFPLPGMLFLQISSVLLISSKYLLQCLLLRLQPLSSPPLLCFSLLHKDKT